MHRDAKIIHKILHSVKVYIYSADKNFTQSSIAPVALNINTGRVYSVQCTLYFFMCTVNSALCTVYCVQYTVYSVQCTVFFVQCTVYNVLCSET